MPEYLGPVLIPEIAPSGTWPLPVDYGMVYLLEPPVVVHRFPTGDAQREQRFYLGDGQRRIRLTLPNLNTARKDLVTDFWEARRGPYEPFTLEVAEPDGTTPATQSAFAGYHLARPSPRTILNGSIEPIEILHHAHLRDRGDRDPLPQRRSQDRPPQPGQEVFPLIHIRTLSPAYDIYVSDRRVQVDGQLYQPRLSTGMDRPGHHRRCDDASFRWVMRTGSSRRLPTLWTWRASIEFSLSTWAR
jgi:hypothetical protein